MKKKQIANALFFLILGFSLLPLSCEQAEKPINGKQLAQVGKSILYEHDVLRRLPENFDNEQKKAFITNFREQWIRKELIVQEAKRSGLADQEELKLKIEDAGKDVLAQAYRDYWLSNTDSVQVSLNEVQTFYENNKDQFILQERHIRFRHIKTADLESCKAAKSELMRGISFETVVQKYALDKVSTLSESQIYYPIQLAASQYPELNKYLQVIGIMEISIIRLLDGKYHFVQITDERPAGTHPDLDWILDRIKEWLIVEKKRKILTTLERELYLKAELNNEIKLFEIN
jgi:hypothetical protein